MASGSIAIASRHIQAEARCVLAWLCHEVVSLANDEKYVHDEWVPLLASCTWLDHNSNIRKVFVELRGGNLV